MNNHQMKKKKGDSQDQQIKGNLNQKGKKSIKSKYMMRVKMKKEKLEWIHQ